MGTEVMVGDSGAPATESLRCGNVAAE